MLKDKFYEKSIQDIWQTLTHLNIQDQDPLTN